jgi:hypothetical protein
MTVCTRHMSKKVSPTHGHRQPYTHTLSLTLTHAFALARTCTHIYPHVESMGERDTDRQNVGEGHRETGGEQEGARQRENRERGRERERERRKFRACLKCRSAGRSSFELVIPNLFIRRTHCHEPIKAACRICQAFQL